jgi:hypothetical protein
MSRKVVQGIVRGLREDRRPQTEGLAPLTKVAATMDSRGATYVNYFTTFWDIADDRCRRYYGTPGPSGHAAGLESLTYFAALVIESMPDSWQQATIVDAGAGASSAILRTYFDNVISCDPDADYLALVQRTCADMGLPEGRWEVGVPNHEADATFYDYGTSERIPLFPEFLRLSRRLIWIDDAHDRELLEACTAVCRDLGLVVHPARGSHDNIGRFGAYVNKGSQNGARVRPEQTSELDALRHELEQLRRDWQHERRVSEGKSELLRIYEQSWSWRLTKPFRALVHR